MIYLLKNNNDVIHKTNCESYELALEYFSKVKKLSKKDLLKIYKIEKQ